MRAHPAVRDGQTTVEYAVLVALTVLVCVSAVAALRAAVLDFYYEVASLICLPIP